MQKYWINVIPKDRVLKAVEEGIMQSQGDEAHLSRIQKDDMVVFYSPREDSEGTKKLQTFTAVGQIADEEIYPVQGAVVKAFRRKINYTECQEISVIPLIQNLHFIRNKKHWGFVFKQSLIQILQPDFETITNGMVEKVL